MPKVLSLAWEKILEIEHALKDKHCQPEDILELFQRLYNDVQNIHEDLALYINTPSWGCPTVCYNDDDDEDCTIAITPKEPDNSLNFTIFSNLLFDADNDFSFSDDHSFSDEDISTEIYSNPLFDEEIISMKIDPHHFNANYDHIESLLNHDSSITSSKIDSLFDEFAETRLIKRLLYDKSSPRPPEEFVSKNFDAAIESFSPSPIPVEDSDSFIKEIDLSFTSNDPMPPGIEEDDYDSERDILILKHCLAIIPLHFLKISQFILIFLHPLVLLQNHRMEKSPNLLSHQGHETSQPFTECPMMIYGRNTPILDVPFLHFYPP
nr:hypothetical protein [Tanacetum cinerariifolium]